MVVQCLSVIFVAAKDTYYVAVPKFRKINLALKIIAFGWISWCCLDSLPHLMVHLTLGKALVVLVVLFIIQRMCV